MYRRLGLGLALALTASGCGEREPVQEERYEIRGTIVSADRDAGTVTVSHEEVEGFMGAMTMPFPLADEWAFDSMEPGDRIDAILVVRGREHWLEQVVLSRAPPELEAALPLPIGEQVPDVELVNQDGESIRLSDFRGRTLLVTFIYTRCPLSDFCPRMTSHFGSIEAALVEEPELYRGTHLLTVSFDPDYDTPETLRAYAEREAGVTSEGFSHWTFATGEDEAIRELASFLQLDYVVAHGEIVHNLRTAVIAPDGTLLRVYRGNSWSPEEILEELGPEPSESLLLLPRSFPFAALVVPSSRRILPRVEVGTCSKTTRTRQAGPGLPSSRPGSSGS